MTVFQAVLSSDTDTLRIIKTYEEAVTIYTEHQNDANFKNDGSSRTYINTMHGITMLKLKLFYQN